MYLSSDHNRIVVKESFYAPEAKILVVDDTRMNLIVMKELLKQTGVQIDTADSGIECLFMVVRNRYHIIFLDIKMPEMDGIETLRRLLTMEGNLNKNTPVIALTANNITDSSEYIREGFSDCASKPVGSKDLERMVLKYLPGELVQEVKSAEKNEPIPGDGTVEIPDIAGLDALMGIQACGTIEIYLKALKEFYLTADDRIQEIEYFKQTESYHDYTIKVHALKSTAYLIGAKALSDMAQYLEECGTHENIREINQKTAVLTEHYRELTKEIKTYINKKGDSHNRPLIKRESFIDAIHTIYEFVEAFDFDSADSIMEMLDEYTIPDAYDESTQRLKVLLIDVERDNIMQLISAMEEQTYSDPSEENTVYIPGINVKSALDTLGGSVTEYINILKAFADDENERVKQIEECYRTEKIELYTIYTHSLKSSSAIVGAEELSKLAAKMEMAGKERNLAYIHENHEELVTKAHQILEYIACYLQQCDCLENGNKEQGDTAFLFENLAKIEGALTEYEIGVAEDTLSLLNNKQWSETISAMILKINQKMQSFDYDDVQSLVGQLLTMEEKELC